MYVNSSWTGAVAVGPTTGNYHQNQDSST